MLCGDCTENMDHLFFQCNYTKRIWERIKQRNGVDRICGSWREEIQSVIAEYKTDCFGARLKCLALGAAVYCIWYMV